ncbi:MAG: hypothetical protein ACR2II_05400 [Chthoniobacterales bacterium]
MKTKLLRVTAALGAIICCLVVASCICRFPSPWGNEICFEKYRIRIPGNPISVADQEAMNRILSEYDTSLYRIQPFRGGVPCKKGDNGCKPIGTLSSEFLPQAVVREIFENAQTHSLTGTAIQAGRGFSHKFHQNSPVAQSDEMDGNPGSSLSTPDKVVARIGIHFHQIAPSDDEELVKRLRPILEKYNKK